MVTDDLDHILDATASDWEAVRGRTIVLTGGTGFVGRWLLESFVHANDRLGLQATCIVLTRNPGRFISAAPRLARHRAVQLAEGDVRIATFPAGEWYGVIHAAAESRSRFAHDEAVQDVIVNGTRRMIACARERSAEKFLFVSSGAVYGTLSGEAADESRTDADASGSQSSYGRAKREAELECLGPGLRSAATIARLFTFVGPWLPLDERFAVGNFIADGLEGRPIRIDGDGRSVRSYLYAADMAAWLWTVFFRGTPGRVYNIGSGEPITITDIAMRTASLFDPVSRVVMEPSAAASPGASYYVPSVVRITAELGVTVSTDLGAAVHKTIGWHRLMRQEKAERP